MTENDRQDIEDMLKTASGDMDAFCNIVHRNQNILLNFFLRLGAKKYGAEDLVQDTFLRLYQWRKKYQPTAKFSTFMFMLARHVWIDSRRKGKRSLPIVNDDVPETVSDGVDHTVDADLHMDVQQALDGLSEKLRMVVVLNVYHGLNYKEIGDTLDIPEGTVKSRMWQAMRQLRDVFGVEEE